MSIGDLLRADASIRETPGLDEAGLAGLDLTMSRLIEHTDEVVEQFNLPVASNQAQPVSENTVGESEANSPSHNPPSTPSGTELLPDYWFHSGRAGRETLATQFDHMRLRHLGLSVRTLNALLRSGQVRSVGDLVRADISIMHVRNLGPRGLDELDQKVKWLIGQSSSPEPSNSSTSDQTLQSNLLSHAVISLDHISLDVRAIPIARLHLKNLTYQTLLGAGITTLGSLLDATRSSSRQLLNLGRNIATDVDTHLDAVASSLRQEGELDWSMYLRLVGIQIIPNGLPYSATVPEAVAKLPAALRDLVVLKYDDRCWLIVQRRFGLDGVRKLTFEDIGQGLGGVSRERVRQLESKTLRHLSDTLFGGNYTGHAFHLHPAIESFVATLDTIWEKRGFIREDEVLRTLSGMLNADLELSKPYLTLLLELSEACPLDLEDEEFVPIWTRIEGSKRKAFTQHYRRLHALLTREHALDLPEFEVLVALNSDVQRGDKLTLEDLRKLAAAANTIEYTGERHLRGRFEYLEGRAHQAERILRESGEPLTAAHISQEINHRLAPHGKRLLRTENLSNQLANDDRFVPIGRSGSWGLKAWNLETRSILDLMEKCLTIHNRPMSANEIFTYVQESRPVNPNSIAMYLTTNQRFRKVGHTHWGLASWPRSNEQPVWDREGVAKFIETFFKQARVAEVEYGLLTGALMEVAGISARQARGLLISHPAIKTRKAK